MTDLLTRIATAGPSPEAVTASADLAEQRDQWRRPRRDGRAHSPALTCRRTGQAAPPPACRVGTRRRQPRPLPDDIVLQFIAAILQRPRVARAIYAALTRAEERA